MSEKVRDRKHAEALTQSTSSYLKEVLKQKPAQDSWWKGNKINWNYDFVEKTIEKLESEDDKSANSSDQSQ